MKIKNLKIYNKCLIVVDMVNGFVKEGVLHDNNITHIIKFQKKLIENYIKEGDLIVFIKDTHYNNSTEFNRFGNTTHCLKGTSEAELVDELKIYEGLKDTISIEKNSTSFMEAPKFRELIRNLKDIKEVDVVGCCTDICVFNGSMGLANYFDQNNLDVQIRVYEEGVETYARNVRENYVDAANLLMEQQGIQLVKKMGGK
ncbi:MAG: isochorismatase family cysteine hydrolase [bacterium]|nr:isochorismatase family cysteine hydrolase [bacterium]